MRYLFVIILIALLPLRGWAGHVMAIDMAAQQVAAAKNTITSEADNTAKATLASMPADCPMLGQQGTDDSSSSPKPTCSCDTCELCLAMATSVPVLWSAGAASMHSEPLVFGIGFSSAERTSSLKPPIS